MSRRTILHVGFTFVLSGCALFGPDERAQIAGTLNAVEQCQEKARKASIECLAEEESDEAECDPRAMAAYKACKRDGGL